MWQGQCRGNEEGWQAVEGKESVPSEDKPGVGGREEEAEGWREVGRFKEWTVRDCRERGCKRLEHKERERSDW